MAYESPLVIVDVIKGISDNKYILPSIQREFVWDAERIARLFDSLMQGYPIGAFLFWEVGKDKIGEYQFYKFLEKFHEKDHKHNEKLILKESDFTDGNRTAILDGQQRLTSLYIGLKGTYASKVKYKRKNRDDNYPERKLYLNLVGFSEDEGNKYEFSFLADEEVENTKDKFWFEVGEILNMQQQADITKFIMDKISYGHQNYEKEQAMIAANTLSQLYKVIHVAPTISYYKEKSEELDKVLNIFVRVNSGGMVLSYSDLLLSTASALWKDYDAREEITDFVDEVNGIGKGFNINKDFVLKTALVLSGLDMKFKVDNFNKKNMEIIEKSWEDIKRAIYLTVKLIDSFGYSGKTLSSNNALIPIAYHLKKIGLPDKFSESGKFDEDRKKNQGLVDCIIVETNF